VPPFSRALVVNPVPPTVVVNALTTPAVAGAPVTFTATVTGGLGPFSFAWTFEGGTPPTATSTSTGATTSAATTFGAIGMHDVRVTVTDHLGRQDASPIRTVNVVAPPAPQVTVSIVEPPAPPFTAPVTVTFRATVQNGLGPFTYAWTPLPVALLLQGATYVGPTNGATVQIRFTQAFSGNIGVTVREIEEPQRSDSDTIAVTVAAPPPGG
jgi:hypothetical protein